MSGDRLAQPYGAGRTEQRTIIPGTVDGAPKVTSAATYVHTLLLHDRWRLIGAAFDLVTVNTAGNRYVQVQYPDGTGQPTARDLTGFAQVAAKTVHYAGALDGLIAQDGAPNVTASFRLSGQWLEIGRQVVIAIVGFQAGDELANVRLTYDRTLVRDDGSQAIRDLEHAQRLAAELNGVLGG